MGMTWKEIARVEDEAMTTVQSRFYKFTGAALRQNQRWPEF